jgi:hypothetical protein
MAFEAEAACPFIRLGCQGTRCMPVENSARGTWIGDGFCAGRRIVSPAIRAVEKTV